MAIFESIFDILYLTLVIGLGIRLLLETKKSAKWFGIMAVLLGLGDAFHLIPRVISHLSPSGFAGHGAALSWGQFVTSITMTLFYILYYYFYRGQSGDRDSRKTVLVYALSALRIALTLLPQNLWGQTPGDYMFGIYRNIPFLILGILLIAWSYRNKEKAGLAYMWWLILLSFLFYLPVVLWSRQYPAVGAFMMPKTVAYLMTVVLGYRYFVGSFQASHLLGTAFANLVMGLAGGVFYREFTRYYQFTEANHLGKIHVHTIVLGFAVLTIFYLLVRLLSAAQQQTLRKPFYVFEAGLIFTVVNMVVIGVYEVVGLGQETVKRAVLDGISGLGHITLAAGLTWLAVRFYQLEKAAAAAK